MRYAMAVGGMVALLALGACGGGDDTAEPAATTAEVSAPSRACTAATDILRLSIGIGGPVYDTAFQDSVRECGTKAAWLDGMDAAFPNGLTGAARFDWELKLSNWCGDNSMASGPCAP